MNPVGASVPHESARSHVTGAARYVDDLPAPPGLLHAWVVASPHAHARISRRDATRARAMPGVRAVLFHDDIPGARQVGPVVHDEDLLAGDTVACVGHAVAVVIADTREQARVAAGAVEVHYEALPAVLNLDDAIAQGSFQGTPMRIARGDVDAAIASAALVVRGIARSGAQDHFYLETHAALVVPNDARDALHVWSSTQHPSEVQGEVSDVLGVPRSRVTVEVPRLGGGFGGKESQASQVAAWAALGAWTTGRPVKLWLDRAQDMGQTGKRHPFRTDYEAAFDAKGRILALRARVFADGGHSLDLSQAICDRALFHLDNAYYLPAVDFEGRVCRTHLLSNTAFRGFGGPQGVLAVEDAIQTAAERLGVDASALRAINLYGDAPRDRTPYGMTVENPRGQRIWEELSSATGYVRRRAAVDAHNQTERHARRGLAFQPVKFGISFTATLLNQAGALVHVYTDGSVQLNHGGIEMGQGLHTKMLAVCAQELGVPVDQVRAMNTATDKVPNTSATAASSGADLNGMAVQAACAEIRSRMAPVAAELLHTPVEDLIFANGLVRGSGNGMKFAALAKECWVRRISLSSTGYYATPDLGYDRAAGQGRPFYYFAWGGALVEVEIDLRTGMHRVVRADIVHDVGDSLSPAIDIGQVEGAFVQGVGWLTGEQVIYDAKGRLATRGPSTYKIPAVGDVPEAFHVRLLDHARQAGTIHGSKAVGEPPLVLGIGVISALRDAISAARGGGEVNLSLPATAESVLRALHGV